MKIYISVDMEGIIGVVYPDFLTNRGYDYSRARKFMTEDVNAAVRGALMAGAQEIIVNDSHNAMTNVLVEELQSPAKLITGSPKLHSMMEGLDSTFDGAIFIGYHSKMNSRGVLNHTFSSRTVYKLKLNNQEIGELEFNAYIAGFYNVPVLMVSGDDQVAREAQNLIEGVKTVAVKEARGRYTALCLNPKDAHSLIEENAYKAVAEKDKISPLQIQEPLELRITLLNSGMADAAQIMPGVERIGANILQYTATDIIEAYQAFRTITILAGSIIQM